MKAKRLDAGKYADGQGLWLIKRNKFQGKWIVRVVVGGKRREMGLGPWPDVSIAEARQNAAQARKLVRKGQDPILERQRERAKLRARLTVEQAIEGCFKARQAEPDLAFKSNDCPKVFESDEHDAQTCRGTGVGCRSTSGS